MWACSVCTSTSLNGMDFVESGKMMVKVWQKDYDLVDETILNVIL